jgi:hypothetical protein
MLSDDVFINYVRSIVVICVTCTRLVGVIILLTRLGHERFVRLCLV